jgi:hypothetical protein
LVAGYSTNGTFENGGLGMLGAVAARRRRKA